MQIENIGYNYIHDKNFAVQRPKGSGDYLFLLIHTPAVFIFESKEINTRGNTIILYKEGTPQYYKANGKDFINDWFHFTVSDMEWLEKLKLPIDVLIKECNITIVNELSSMIMDMANEKTRNSMYSKDILELKLRCFLMRFSELMQENDDKQINFELIQVIQKIKNEICNHPYLKWSIPAISAQVNMSPSYFQHIYKRHFGVSCMNDIIKSRIDYSKYQLAKSDFKIKYIAEICGYDNEEHFMRQFKKCVGQTPSEYRRMYSEN